MVFGSSGMPRCALPSFVFAVVVQVSVSCSDPAAPRVQGEGASGANDRGGALGSGAVGGMSGAPISAGASGSGAGGVAGNAGAGTPAAASSGATGVAGATGPSGGATGSGSCAGALLCDDFEAYNGVPSGPWTVRTNQGTVAIDGTKHVSGKQSVKFSTTGVNTYQRAFIGLEQAPFPIQGNAFYGRMMIYAAKAANDGVHWTMIQAEGPVPAQGISDAFVRYGGQQMQSLMANYDSVGKKSDCWQHSATKMPEAQWACMQWYFDGPTNTQKFWLNGVAIDDLTVSGQGQGCIAHETNDTWYFPQSFDKAYVGWESYQKDDPREIWIDDVAIGTKPIGCPVPSAVGTL